MSEPYLIAHKVRGEPAFDIAIQLEGSGTESDPGPWWIIPTSGHRAYPYWELPLCEASISHEADTRWCGLGQTIFKVPPMPEGHPDHYTTHAAPGRGVIRNLAEVLGLIQPRPGIRRR